MSTVLEAPGSQASREHAPTASRRARATATTITAAVACSLAAALVLALDVGPRLLPYRTFAILSGSMAPTLPVGSEAVLRPVDASELRVGDVITFHRPDGDRALVTHRIVGIERRNGERTFVTKGDANAVADAWRVPAAGAGWRYSFDVPFVGYGAVALGTPIVRFGIAAAIALALAGGFLRALWRPDAAR